MKKSDWALIIIIVVVVAVVSWFIIGSILPPQDDEKVKTAPSISSSVAVPENNMILYDKDRPNWCLESVGSAADDKKDNPEDNPGDNPGEAGTDDKVGNTAGRQYINSVFNSCSINSSFTTTTK
jgi:hypothetical protein